MNNVEVARLVNRPDLTAKFCVKNGLILAWSERILKAYDFEKSYQNPTPVKNGPSKIAPDVSSKNIHT
jgi:hypothetical protein